jgi:hypothetical protein
LCWKEELAAVSGLLTTGAYSDAVLRFSTGKLSHVDALGTGFVGSVSDPLAIRRKRSGVLNGR